MRASFFVCSICYAALKPRPFVRSFFVFRSSICMRPDSRITRVSSFSPFLEMPLFPSIFVLLILCNNNKSGTQLRDPINSGLTRWRLTVQHADTVVVVVESARNHQIRPETSWLTRDETTAEPVSRDQFLRRERGQGKKHFPCSADHERD